MRARRRIGLPCPWAPLQSVTTAASREFPFRFDGAVYLRGKATGPLGAACYASGSDDAPEGTRAESSLSVEASLGGSEAGMLGARCLRRVVLGPKPGLDTVRCHEWQHRARTCSQRASLDPEPRRGGECFFEVRCSAEAES
jgi:hypothetical protein